MALYNHEDDQDLDFALPMASQSAAPAASLASLAVPEEEEFPVAAAEKPRTLASLADVEKAEEKANKQKAYLGILGNVAQSFQDIPSAHEMLYKGQHHGSDMKGLMNGIAGSIQSPMDNASKAAAYMKAQRDEKMGAEKDAYSERLKDDTKPAAKAFKQALISAGGDPDTINASSAYDLMTQGYSPAKMAEIKARAAVELGNQKVIHGMDNATDIEKARIAAQERARDKHDSKSEKLQLEKEGRNTPFGEANTLDDAKQLKDAYESKKNFDSKIQEMIDLRTKHGGGAMLNREDVARGQQLSKDLLLEYKNMAKLGVLSVSDEKILNKIIPADPLEYNSIVASVQGQDPILNNLKKFKADSERDFQTRVQTRTKGGGKAPADQPQRTILKTQTNQKTGAKRIVYSDGSTEDVPSSMAGK